MSTILAVEDSPELLDLYRSVLEACGHRVEVARSGGEALRAVGGHGAGRLPPPDLVLLDLAMPGGDGLAFLRAARGAPGWARVPVIVVSGFARERDWDEAQRLGATERLRKASFSCRQLRSLVARCLSGG